MGLHRRIHAGAAAFGALALTSILGYPPSRSALPATECPIDSGVTRRPRWVEPPEMERSRALIDSLELSLASAQDRDRPSLLFALGSAKARYSPRARTRHEAYARAHPADFQYFEPGASWIYNGTDFREIIRRYPQSELADDAGYAITLIPRGSDCEGWIPCYVGVLFDPLQSFLREFPASPLADSAVDRALGAFHMVSRAADLRVESGDMDPNSMRPLVVQLEETGRFQLPPRRARLLTRAGELWTQFVDYDRARAAYTAALGGASGAARTCIQERLAALSTPTFVLEPPRPIHTHRVELYWNAWPSATGYAVYRSTEQADSGSLVGRVPSMSTRWTDTLTQPASTYWYRVAAQSATGAARSNSASASTPTRRFQAHTAAVSVTDSSLYVFGALDNGFPQLRIVAPDGSVRSGEGLFLGMERNTFRGREFDDYVDEIYVAGASGRGVLKFRKAGGQLPSALFASARTGGVMLRRPADRKVLVSVDESWHAIWAHPGGGGAYAPMATDCVATPSYCWLGFENDVRKVGDDGRAIRTIRLPGAGLRTEDSFATGVWADPTHDGVWVYQNRSGRLLYLDRTDSVRFSREIADRGRGYSVQVAVDRQGRMVWYSRRAASLRFLELVRLDFNLTDPQPVVVVDSIPGFPSFFPDLAGGVWVMNQSNVSRFDASGRVLVSVKLEQP